MPDGLVHVPQGCYGLIIQLQLNFLAQILLNLHERFIRQIFLQILQAFLSRHHAETLDFLADHVFGQEIKICRQTERFGPDTLIIH
ncbi:hypothetical protein SDC9_78888 [bioreactor metagenome]|uniref:Uncharacterized protein n=1 Tax=bioreactor metagenome TaxID=1076179 RepID=A0A644YUW7_9ZZZZ